MGREAERHSGSPSRPKRNECRKRPGIGRMHGICLGYGRSRRAAHTAWQELLRVPRQPVAEVRKPCHLDAREHLVTRLGAKLGIQNIGRQDAHLVPTPDEPGCELGHHAWRATVRPRRRVVRRHLQNPHLDSGWRTSATSMASYALVADEAG